MYIYNTYRKKLLVKYNPIFFREEHHVDGRLYQWTAHGHDSLPGHWYWLYRKWRYESEIRGTGIDLPLCDCFRYMDGPGGKLFLDQNDVVFILPEELE